jgi:hypothetical protein
LSKKTKRRELIEALMAEIKEEDSSPAMKVVKRLEEKLDAVVKAMVQADLLEYEEEEEEEDEEED